MNIVLTSAHLIEPEPINWIWDGFLAKGMLHIISGKPGSGKTTIALDLAARISSGSNFPDGKSSIAGNILIWSGEDSIQHVLVPRLIAAGADLERIKFIDSRKKNGENLPFDPAHDMELLRNEASNLGEISLIIIDSLASVITKDSHKNAETRRDLQPTVDLAKELNCAVVGIMHFAKGTAGKDPLERILGSVAFGAVARFAFVVGRNSPTDQADIKRIFIRAKSIAQEGGGFHFSITDKTLNTHKNINTSTVVWAEWANGGAQSLLDSLEIGDDSDNVTALEGAKSFLIEELKNGPVPSAEILSNASKQGISKSTLFRAKDRLKVKAKKQKDQWFWTLEPYCEKAHQPEERHPWDDDV